MLSIWGGSTSKAARVVIAPDDELAQSGVARASSARVPLATDGARDRDRAAVLLQCALEQCARELDGLSPDWRTRRVGLAVGTSAGAMATTEKCLAALSRGSALSRDMARGTPYFAPLEQATTDLRLQFFPRAVVLGACASSTLALGLAMRWLDLGRCDLVLAGGFDVALDLRRGGIRCPRATTATVPRPFRLGRDGMALGEGAAILALAKTPTAGESHRRSSYLAGFGASTDAIHLTAPDRTGTGLARAAMRALADAEMRGTDVGLVSAHATATPFNDPAEAKALTQALGDSTHWVVHPMKAQIGHTLGAAGALESLGAFDALARGIGPAAAGVGDLDPDCAVTLLEKMSGGVRAWRSSSLRPLADRTPPWSSRRARCPLRAVSRAPSTCAGITRLRRHSRPVRSAIFCVVVIRMCTASIPWRSWSSRLLAQWEGRRVSSSPRERGSSWGIRSPRSKPTTSSRRSFASWGPVSSTRVAFR